MNLFFYQINKTSSLSISSHITRSSPDHLGQFSLTQSLLSQRTQTRHSTPDVSPSIQKRNITLPSPCWPCFCQYSPAGEASLQCHNDTLMTHTQLPVPCKSFMQSVPSLSSCTAVTSQGQDQNLTMLSCRPPGLMALFPISSATALPISCQHRLAGAVLEHYSYEGFLSEITNQPRCKSSQKTSTKGCHFSK